MARAAAQQTLTYLAHKYHWAAGQSRSSLLHIDGGDIDAVAAQVDALLATNNSAFSATTAQELAQHFGRNALEVLALSARTKGAVELIPDTDMPVGAIDYTVVHEWTLTLPDLLLRRLELRRAGRIQPATLQFCARHMATLLGWNAQEQARQLQAVTQQQRVASTQPDQQSRVAAIREQPVSR
jgi:glycerol-3-phosphate dehydrogenase